MENTDELKDFTLSLQEKLKTRDITKILEEAFEEGKHFGNIPVVHVDPNKLLTQDDMEKFLEFQKNLRCNDYSDISKRAVLTQNVKITPSNTSGYQK